MCAHTHCRQPKVRWPKCRRQPSWVVLPDSFTIEETSQNDQWMGRRERANLRRSWRQIKSVFHFAARMRGCLSAGGHKTDPRKAYSMDSRLDDGWDSPRVQIQMQIVNHWGHFRIPKGRYRRLRWDMSMMEWRCVQLRCIRPPLKFECHALSVGCTLKPWKDVLIQIAKKPVFWHEDPYTAYPRTSEYHSEEEAEWELRVLHLIEYESIVTHSRMKERAWAMPSLVCSCLVVTECNHPYQQTNN